MNTTIPRSRIRPRASADFNLSVRILDRDHRELSETIEYIQADMIAGKDRGRTSPLLAKLTGFTRSHFGMEEAMMAAAEYPGLPLHFVGHQSMMKQLKAFTSSYNRGRSNMGVNLPLFLAEWHAAHGRNEDLHLGRWLNGEELYESKQPD